MHIFIYTYTCIYICKYQKATQKSTKALKRFLRALRQLCRSRFRLNLYVMINIFNVHPTCILPIVTKQVF